MTAAETALPATGAHSARLRQRRPSPFEWFGLALALFLAILATYPIGRVVFGLFWVDGAPSLDVFRAVLAEDDLGLLLFNTYFVVAMSTVIGLAAGAVFAWLNERTDARVGVLTDSLPLIPFILPAIAGSIGWVLLLSPGAGLANAVIRGVLGWFGIEMMQGPFDVYSMGGLIFVYALYQVPFAFMMISAALRNLDPALEQQARVCGAGILRTLVKVTIPAVLPSLGAAVMLMIWHGFALYSVPVIIGSGANIEILSVRIVKLLTFTYPPESEAAIGLSLIIVLTVGIAWVIQGRILKSNRFASIGGKGGTGGARIRLGAWRRPAQALIFGYVILAALLPIAALLIVSLNGFWTPFINWSDLRLDLFRKVIFEDLVTQRSLKNSIYLGFVGATIGMGAAAILALLMARRSSALLRAIDGAIKFPAAISGIVVGVGFVLAFNGAPFYLSGTLTILLLAYLVQFMPKATVTAEAAAAQVGRELLEAAHVSGAGSGRVFARVALPLMTPGLVAGWALLFVHMAGDLTVTVMLSGFRNIVVGFQILDIFHSGSFAQLAALALCLTFIDTAVVMIAYFLSARRARKLGMSLQMGARTA